MKFEVWAHLQNQQMKFFYSLTGITFAILGLSIQFSPSYGKSFPYFLVSSWSILLLSAFVGGWRLVTMPNLTRLDQELEPYRDYLKKINLVSSAPVRIIGDIPTQERAEVISKQIEDAQKYINSRQSFVEIGYHIQIWGFLVGIILNLIFISGNFLIFS